MPTAKVVIRDDGEEDNIDMKNEVTHLDIGTLRGTQANVNMDARTPTSLSCDFPDPDIAMP